MDYKQKYLKYKTKYLQLKGGYKEENKEDKEEIFHDLTTPCQGMSSIDIQFEGSRWDKDGMYFGSHLDNYVLESIYYFNQNCINKNKTILLTGNSYFLLLSLIYTNCKLIFVDINTNLINAMKECYDKLLNGSIFQEYGKSYEGLFTYMSKLNLNEPKDLMKKIKRLFPTIKFEDFLAAVKENKYYFLNASFTDNQEELHRCLVSIAREGQEDSSLGIDFFNTTNLLTGEYRIENEMVSFMALLKGSNPEIYFHTSNGLANMSFIYKDIKDWVLINGYRNYLNGVGWKTIFSKLLEQSGFDLLVFDRNDIEYIYNRGGRLCELKV
tara:strand:+ start:5522 stop:6496 length:975 start_codon:yes stop_codon:yes gene_type:complete